MLSDDQLLRGCLARERSAQRALYERYSPVLMAIAVRYVRHRETAQDLLADAWIKAFGALPTFSGNGSLEGWLKRIATNECLMYLRKRRIDYSELSPAVAATTPVDMHVTDALEAETVDALLDTLPDGCRLVFNLYELEGYKHREIAEQLGISINTSKSQLILAKRKLREAYSRLSAREGDDLRPLPYPPKP